MVLEWALIVLQAGCFVEAALIRGEKWRALYWLGAVILTAAVIMLGRDNLS